MEINLTELFETQRKLDAEIERKHPTAPGEERLAKRILALQVELGELANEWRGFKFWSTDQEPRVKMYHFLGSDDRMHKSYINPEEDEETLKWIGVERVDEVTNPLLEEYVDCLHFILSIGNDIGIEIKNAQYPFVVDSTTEYQFLTLMQTISSLNHLLRFGNKKPFDTYNIALMQFINLGKMLNFTEEKIVDAYMSKNKTNWERQENGY